MESVYVMARGVDHRWHLWSSEGRQVTVRRYLTVADGESAVVDPPATWREICGQGVTAIDEAAHSRCGWDCVVAMAFMRVLVMEILEEEFPPYAASASAHACWWLGEGGTVRLTTADEVRLFCKGSALRGSWTQLELGWDREFEGSSLPTNAELGAGVSEEAD